MSFSHVLIGDRVRVGREWGTVRATIGSRVEVVVTRRQKDGPQEVGVWICLDEIRERRQ